MKAIPKTNPALTQISLFFDRIKAETKKKLSVENKIYKSYLFPNFRRQFFCLVLRHSSELTKNECEQALFKGNFLFVDCQLALFPPNDSFEAVR